MYNPPALVRTNAPSERKALVRSGRRPVQLLVCGSRKQRLPAQQTVEMIGGVASKIADRAMDRSRRPEGDGEQIRVVQRLLDELAVLPEVSAWLLGRLRIRGPPEPHARHAQRSREPASDQVFPRLSRRALQHRCCRGVSNIRIGGIARGVVGLLGGKHLRKKHQPLLGRRAPERLQFLQPVGAELRVWRHHRGVRQELLQRGTLVFAPGAAQLRQDVGQPGGPLQPAFLHDDRREGGCHRLRAGCDVEAIVDAKPVSRAHPPETRHGARDNLASPHNDGGESGQAMLCPDLLELLLKTRRIGGWVDPGLTRAVARQKCQREETPTDPAHSHCTTAAAAGCSPGLWPVYLSEGCIIKAAGK